MWNYLGISEQFCERIWGFSIPQDHQLVVISSEGIHTVDLREPTVISHDYDHPEGGDLYDGENQILVYQGKRFRILGGELGGDQQQPILRNRYEEQIVLYHEQQFFQILQKGEVIFEDTFEDLSGDWAVITFSEDGQYIVLGLPYELYVYERLE